MSGGNCHNNVELKWNVFVLRHSRRCLSHICDSTSMCRLTEKEDGPMIGFLCHRLLVGVLLLPIKAPARGQPFPLTNSDHPTNKTFHNFHDLDTDFDLHRIASGFHGAFATGMACQQRTLTLPDTWFRPPFWDLQMPQLLRPNSSNFPCLYSTFHLKYPLVLSRFCSYHVTVHVYQI